MTRCRYYRVGLPLMILMLSIHHVDNVQGEASHMSHLPVTQHTEPTADGRLADWMERFQSQYSQDITELRQRLREQQALTQDQGQLIQQLQDKNSAQQDQIEQLQDKNSAQQDQIEQLQDQIEQLQDKNSAQQAQTEQLQDQTRAQQDQIEQLQDKNSSQQDQIEQLQDKNSAQQGQIEQLQDKNSAHQDQIEQLQDQKCLQQNEMQELEQLLSLLQTNPKPKNTRDQTLIAAEEEPSAKITRSDDNGWEPVVDQITNQLTQVTAQIQALKNVQQDHPIGTAYVRWGHKACPNSSQLVFSGLMGGSYYDQPGGAVNYLCLPHDPHIDNSPVPTESDPQAEVYGSEYQSYDSRYQLDAACALCRSPRSSLFVVPAKTSCPAGWTEEYHGHLMSGTPEIAAASEFICVDDQRAYFEGTDRNDNGKLLYFTVTHCGSLPCPPYVNHTLVTCIVCSI